VCVCIKWESLARRRGQKTTVLMPLGRTAIHSGGELWKVRLSLTSLEHSLGWRLQTYRTMSRASFDGFVGSLPANSAITCAGMIHTRGTENSSFAYQPNFFLCSFTSSTTHFDTDSRPPYFLAVRTPPSSTAPTFRQATPAREIGT